MNAPNFQVVMLAKGKARVDIYDAIGPSFFGMIDTKLVRQKLEEAGELTEIECHINSPGGFVFEGIGIHNVLKNHPATVNVIIDGQAASVASLIAMAGNTIRIPTNGAMFLHDSITRAEGNKADLKKAIEDLDAANTAAIATYAARTKQPEATVAKWLKDETWFVGQTAVDAGLADMTDQELPAERVAVASAVRQAFSTKQERDSAFFQSISMQLKQEPPIMANPTTPVTPAAPPVTPPVAAAIVPSVPAVPSAPPAQQQLTAADVQATATKAVADERSRIASVMAVCQKAGKPDMANEFIANGTSLTDVQTRMFEVLCAARPPVGDAGGTDDSAKPKDPEAALKKEYADNRVTLQKAGVTEEDYVSSRKVTDEHMGRVAMLPKPEKKAQPAKA